MTIRRPSGTAKFEAQILEGWKRLAARRAGSAQAVAEGRCFLEARPCPFERRQDFENRFGGDCTHCPRVQAAAEQAGVPLPGKPGVPATLPLLLALLERDGSEPADGVDDDGRYHAAAVLLRSLPMLHAAPHRRRATRVLLGAIAGAFPELIDTILYFEASPEGTSLRLEASLRRADLDGPEPEPEGWLDAEALEAAGLFDGAVFDALRDAPLPLDEDRDLLSDAVSDGRTAVVPQVGREFRLPARVVDHLPDGPAAILPIFGRDRVSGVLIVSAAPEIASWTADQIELMSGIAAQAGIAMENAGVLAAAGRREAAVRAVAELGEAELSASHEGLWSEPALRRVLTALNAGILVTWTRDEDGSFVPAASEGEPAAAVKSVTELGTAIQTWFGTDATPILIDSVSNDPRLPGTFPEEWGAAMAVPLRLAGTLRGAFLAVRALRAEGPAVEPFDTQDARIAGIVASILALGAARTADQSRLAHTERRANELEAQLRHADKLAVVGERGILVAQEIRNPIAAITGFARRVLRALGETDPNREYLEIILRETERLERILTEQVAMAQMTRPRLKLASLNALVQEVLELQSEELVRRRVRLLKRLSPDLPSLLIDQDKMRQVLLNILYHALHSVPSGGRVRVETRTGPGVVHVEIAHDGPKVPGESLDRLFVPFHASRRYGAGVGLAVAYQIVREHGGEIRARSEGDWSSIVTVYLPVRENQDRRGKPDRRAGRSDRRRRMA
jgi:signal transduction histidine kinase